MSAPAQFVPAMAAAAAGGVLADRYPRRRILVLTQAAILTIAVGLAAAQLADAATVPVLLTAAALAGTANGLQTPPWQALVPELVPRGQVLNAVALNAMQANAARAVGPAVAGVLLAAWGPASAFAATAAANVVMLTALARISGRRRPRPATAESALRRFAAGIAHTRRHTGLWLAVSVTAAVSFVGTPIVQLAPVLAEDVFAVGAVGYGLLVSGLGVGTVLGAIVLSAYGAGQCRSSIIAVAVAAHAMAAIAVAVAPRFWFALAAVLLLGASYVAVLSTANATIQVVAAEPYRGRAASQYWMAFAGAYPVGALVQGWLTDLVGVRAAVGAAGAALLIALVVVRARPELLDTLDSHSHQAQQPTAADIGRLSRTGRVSGTHRERP